ncbi:MAG: hypothetical protein U1F71_02410 [Verrucomicrobiaceae bacterium]
MARFTINHCRRLQEELCEFDVRVLSGVILEDDSFSFQGCYKRKKYRVLRVESSPPDVTLICEGSVDYGDEITRITLDTESVRLPPLDLPVTANLLVPTSEEERVLKTVIEDWETRAPVQRAICLCLLRGQDTREAIGQTLAISAEDVGTALETVWGVLYDPFQKKLFLK